MLIQQRIWLLELITRAYGLSVNLLVLLILDQCISHILVFHVLVFLYIRVVLVLIQVFLECIHLHQFISGDLLVSLIDRDGEGFRTRTILLINYLIDILYNIFDLCMFIFGFNYRFLKSFAH